MFRFIALGVTNSLKELLWLLDESACCDVLAGNEHGHGFAGAVRAFAAAWQWGDKSTDDKEQTRSGGHVTLDSRGHGRFSSGTYGTSCLPT